MQLDYCVQLAIGPKGYQTYPGLLDLTQREQKWQNILLNQCWKPQPVSGRYRDNAVADGASVCLEVKPKGGHGWYVFTDQGKLSAYCALKPEEAVEPGKIPGSEAVACGLIDIDEHMSFEVMRSDVG